MPPKPRVKAPQRRSASRSDAPADRGRLMMIAAGAATLAAAAAAIFFLVGGGSTSPGEARAALTGAGCTVDVAPGLPGGHSVTDPDATSKEWNTDPPTSGPHNQDTIIYGAYTEEVQIARLLHNLEHGATYILYGDEVPEATVAELQAFYNDHERGTIMAPYAKLGDKIALGAWLADGISDDAGEGGNGVLAQCNGFDEPAFSAFFDAFQFKGPESSFIRPSDMEPGEQ